MYLVPNSSMAKVQSRRVITVREQSRTKSNTSWTSCKTHIEWLSFEHVVCSRIHIMFFCCKQQLLRKNNRYTSYTSIAHVAQCVVSKNCLSSRNLRRATKSLAKKLRIRNHTEANSGKTWNCVLFKYHYVSFDIDQVGNRQEKMMSRAQVYERERNEEKRVKQKSKAHSVFVDLRLTRSLSLSLLFLPFTFLVWSEFSIFITLLLTSLVLYTYIWIHRLIDTQKLTNLGIRVRPEATDS